MFKVSGLYISALAGNLTGSFIGDAIGSKRLLSIIMPISILLWGIQAYPSSLMVLYVARIIIGYFFGLTNTLVNPLISEVTNPNFRGTALVMPVIVHGAGIFLGYMQAHFFSWKLATILFIIPVLPAMIILPFFWEVCYFCWKFLNIYILIELFFIYKQYF